MPSSYKLSCRADNV